MKCALIELVAIRLLLNYLTEHVFLINTLVKPVVISSGVSNYNKYCSSPFNSMKFKIDKQDGFMIDTVGLIIMSQNEHDSQCLHLFNVTKQLPRNNVIFR